MRTTWPGCFYPRLERTGGTIKVMLEQKLTKCKPKQQSRNPYYFMLAAGTHKKYYASGDKGEVATVPNKFRPEILFAYKALIDYATFINLRHCNQQQQRQQSAKISQQILCTLLLSRMTLRCYDQQGHVCSSI